MTYDINEIEDEMTEKIASRTKFYECTYDDGEHSNPKELADDGFIHISRGKYRFVFYNGQEKGMFTEKDCKRFADLVDKAMKKVN